MPEGQCVARRVLDGGFAADAVADGAVLDSGTPLDGSAVDSGLTDAFDAGPAFVDMGMRADASAPDATPVADVGTDAAARDASRRDAVVTDSGPVADAGVVDATPRDAGALDSGAFDVGESDAAPIVDAAPPDSGDPVDSGVHGPCVDDAMEDNDSRGSAGLLSPTSLIDGLISCPGDDDHFSLPLSVGDILAAGFDFAHAEGDIDVQLFDEAGAVVADALSASDGEAIGYQVTTAGRYTLRVFLAADYGPAPGNEYDLEVVVARTGPACLLDQLEPNNSRAAAGSISTGVLTSLSVCSSDNDWFVFNASAQDTVSFTLVYGALEGDVQAALTDANGVHLATSVAVVGGAQLLHTVPVAGTYYLDVFLAADSGATLGNSYALTTVLPGSGSGCRSDRFEPNDTESAAPVLTAAVHANLASCDSDDDYYAVDLTAGATLDVTVDFAHAEGDIDLRLYEQGGIVTLASSITTSAPESFSYNVPTTGRYMIRVNQYLDSGTIPGNSYNMTIRY